MIEKDDNLNKMKEILLEHGIGPSYQRIKIFDFLMKQRIHPSVDEIYQAVYKEIPTLSKTTVYNTLNLFAEHGMVRMLTLVDGEARYDVDMSNHVHFVCDRCGKIYDIFTEEPFFKKEYLDGHQVREEHVYLRGVCRECLANEGYAH